VQRIISMHNNVIHHIFCPQTICHGIEPVEQLINRVATDSISWEVYWSNGYCRLCSSL